jgi:hypothetical protein
VRIIAAFALAFAAMLIAPAWSQEPKLSEKETQAWNYAASPPCVGIKLLRYNGLRREGTGLLFRGDAPRARRRPAWTTLAIERGAAPKGREMGK